CLYTNEISARPTRSMLVLSFFASFFFIISRQPPTSTLFPYTTLFRSQRQPVFHHRRGNPLAGQPAHGFWRSRGRPGCGQQNLECAARLERPPAHARHHSETAHRTHHLIRM